MQIQKPKQGYKIVKSLSGKYEEIPKEWNYSTFKEVLELIIDHRGITPKKLGGNWSEKGIPAISAMNINSGKLVRSEEIRYVDLQMYERWMPEKLLTGDIILTSEAPLGEAYYVENPNFCLSQRLFGLRTRKSLLNSKFLYYFLISEVGQEELHKRGTGTTVKGIRQSELIKNSILLPPLNEQHRIASILSNVDSLIQQTQEIIEQTQRLKKGLVQKLLTKGIGHTKFKKIQLGFRFIQTEIPEDWTVLSLKDLSQDGLSNGIFKKANEFGSGVPLVNVTDLFSEYDIKLKKLEKVKVTKKELEQFGIQSGDVFFCRSSLVRDGIGRSNIILDLTEPSVFECHIMMLRPNSLIHPKFLFYFARSILFKKYLLSIAMTLTMTTIRQPDLESARIVLPSLEEQSVITSILSDLDSKIIQLHNEKSHLENLKKGLMQKLLTGQIRVKV